MRRSCGAGEAPPGSGAGRRVEHPALLLRVQVPVGDENGSDYPHPEGLLWPAEFVEELDGLPEEAVRRIMRDNLASLVA